MSKRYKVCIFPSFNGTPWATDSLLIAKAMAFVRALHSFATWRIVEVRVIDTMTGQHPIIW